jgi:hypothetical protein
MSQSDGTHDDLSPLRSDPFTQVLEELDKLMSQPNRVFLIGAGCGKCASLPLMGELTEQVINDPAIGSATKRVLEFIRTEYGGSHGSTVEDYLSDIVDIAAVVTRRRDCGVTDPRIDIGGQRYCVIDLGKVMEDIKTTMVRFLEPPEFDIGVHRKFVRRVHSLRTGKGNDNNPVDYFVLNYDTLIEDALGLERLWYVDGFTGGNVGWWNTATFSQKGCAARVFKLHGSIDWRLLRTDMSPRRIRNKDLLKSIQDEIAERVMIWPAATKYQETQRDPFAQMLAHFRRSLNPGKSSEVILTICGYRFGDMHVNAEIEKALHDSDKRLTLLVFTGENEVPPFVQRWLQSDIADQVRVHARKGFFHAGQAHLSAADLPWWKFENLVRLLGGER